MDGLEATRARLQNLITKLVAGGWHRRDIFLLGFKQGAVAALDLALHSEERFGGVVAVSGTVLPEDDLASIESSNTPILATHGTSDSQDPINEARHEFQRMERALKERGDQAPVQWREISKGAGMIDSEEEMRPVMEFFAQHIDLADLNGGAHGDVYEVSTRGYL